MLHGRQETFSAFPTRKYILMTPDGTFSSIHKVLQTWKSLKKKNLKSGTEFTNREQRNCWLAQDCHLSAVSFAPKMLISHYPT
jgi:hypothetical protein